MAVGFVRKVFIYTIFTVKVYSINAFDNFLYGNFINECLVIRVFVTIYLRLIASVAVRLRFHIMSNGFNIVALIAVFSVGPFFKLNITSKKNSSLKFLIQTDEEEMNRGKNT